MNYTASSVKAALEALIANKGFHSDNLKNVKCPIVSAIFEDGSKCHMNPKTCEKARRQDCVHRVSVFTRHNALYAAISFRFTISDTNYDGFIYEKDIQLMRLIQHGDIVETDLVKVTA